MTENALHGTDEIALPEPRSNRSVTLGHRAEYAALRVLFALFRAIGPDASSALAGGFLRHVGPLLRPVSKRGEDNLRLVFPDWSEAEIRRTIAGVWENLGRTAAEFAHLDALDPFGPRSRIEIVGAETLKAIAANRQPVIFVSGHFANWETMPVTIHASGIEYGFVYRAANNPLVDALVIQRRAKVMSRLQIPKGKRGGRTLIEALKSGRSLAMLVDQKLNDGISAPFLGHEAMTAPAAARLALKFGAPVIPMSVERTQGFRFRIVVGETLAFTPSGDTSEDVRALTILVNEALERNIRSRPEQWLWLHRRWPKKPA